MSQEESFQTWEKEIRYYLFRGQTVVDPARGHWAASEGGGCLPHLRGDGVLLHEGLLREVELQRVVRRQRHVQAAGKVLGQRRPGGQSE